MPTIHVEATFSPGDLLRAAEQLSPAELDSFVKEVLQLRIRRTAPSVPSAEADLLRTINGGLPEASWQRFAELKAKRQAESVTPQEHAELLRLGEEFERQEVNRLQALSDLARLRKTTLAGVMQDLGLRPPAHE